jgi:AraC family transcriptional regulator, activator of mtrCDE
VGFTGTGPFIVGSGVASQSCKMVCGHYSFADGADHPLLRAIPDILHITAADRAARPMLDDLLRLIVRRMFESEPGADATVTRLSEALFIEAIRAGISHAPEIDRLMSAVYDPQIGKALSLIHGDVAAAWTVESLAAAVGMSRSRFAERFRELVGNGPMAYVADWRLQRALNLLSEGREPIKAVAHRVGYRSAAAFTRAFSDRFGCSPKERRAGAMAA